LKYIMLAIAQSLNNLSNRRHYLL